VTRTRPRSDTVLRPIRVRPATGDSTPVRANPSAASKSAVAASGECRASRCSPRSSRLGTSCIGSWYLRDRAIRDRQCPARWDATRRSGCSGPDRSCAGSWRPRIDSTRRVEERGAFRRGEHASVSHEATIAQARDRMRHAPTVGDANSRYVREPADRRAAFTIGLVLLVTILTICVAVVALLLCA
jgi:hypothetical protein